MFDKCIGQLRVFLWCFRYPIQVPRIENRVAVGPYRVPNIFLKKAWYTVVGGGFFSP